MELYQLNWVYTGDLDLVTRRLLGRALEAYGTREMVVLAGTARQVAILTSTRPDEAISQIFLGAAYSSLGEYERAVKDWEQAIRIDGVLATRWWQTKLKMKGHYSGTIDGIFGPGTRRGMVACARDPNC